MAREYQLVAAPNREGAKSEAARPWAPFDELDVSERGPCRHASRRTLPGGRFSRRGGGAKMETMRFLRLGSLFAAVATLSLGCSALINPDDNRLTGGPGVDSGTADGGAPGDDAGDRDAGPVVVRDAGRDDAGGGRDAGTCTDPDRCEGGVLRTCTGNTICELGCAPGGAARCAVMLPSNVSESYFRGDARDAIVERSDPGDPTLFNTDTCTSTMATASLVTQPDGPELCVLSVRNLTVRGGGYLRINGSRPLAVLATGDIIVESEGVIDVSAYGPQPGPGGAPGGGVSDGDRRGHGLAPGRAGEHENPFDDGGGGGGAFCGHGGDGGGGGAARGGEGGGAIAADLLIPLVGGSGGGVGEGSRFSTGVEPPNLGVGGAGGGAVQLSARGSIRIDGFVVAGGGGGGGGGRRGTGTNWGAGGGGGSGGAVLLESPSITLGSVSGVTTSGGGGGGSASTTGSGAPGGDGAQTLGQAPGGASGGVSLGATGGASGGGGVFNGVNGTTNASDQANGGGGGGGVGCIVFRNSNGALPSGAVSHLSGTGSPALTTTTVLRN